MLLVKPALLKVLHDASLSISDIVLEGPGCQWIESRMWCVRAVERDRGNEAGQRDNVGTCLDNHGLHNNKNDHLYFAHHWVSLTSWDNSIAKHPFLGERGRLLRMPN